MPDQVAKWWRADGGYQDAPPRPPAPPSPPVEAEPAPNMLYYGQLPMQWGWPYGYQQYPLYQGVPVPYYGPPYQGYPAGYPSHVQGPVPIAGLCRPPQSPSKVQEKEESSDDDSDGDKKKKKDKKPNPRAPPALQDHMNYMFASSHTRIHVFKKAAPIWKEKYQGQKLKFQGWTVSTRLTVKDIIDRVICDRGHDPKDWAITQVYEQGDGTWMKGSTMDYDSSRSDGNLESMGWTSRRGDQLAPVWLVVHRFAFNKVEE